MNWSIFWSALGAIVALLTFFFSIFLEWNRYKKRIDESKGFFYNISKLLYNILMSISILIMLIGLILFIDALKIFSTEFFLESQTNKIQGQVAFLYIMLGLVISLLSSFLIEIKQKFRHLDKFHITMDVITKILIVLGIFCCWGILHILSYDFENIYKTTLLTFRNIFTIN